MNHPFTVLVHRTHADKCFTSLRCRCTNEEIQLSTGSGYLSDTCTLRCHLTIQINGNTAIDGNHVINLTDHSGTIHVL